MLDWIRTVFAGFRRGRTDALVADEELLNVATIDINEGSSESGCGDGVQSGEHCSDIRYHRQA